MSLSRRQFLLGKLRQSSGNRACDPPAHPSRHAHAPATAARRPPLLPILRPPGAVHERDFLEGCTKCGECASACPYGAIVPAPARFQQAAGTPMLDPSRSPCHMCEDAPCVEACEPQVLAWEGFGKVGFARIQPFACLAHTGQMCWSCSERCPVEGAITLHDGRPVIDESTCTGCGMCQHVCPAPENAIVLMPSLKRLGLDEMRRRM